MSAYANYIQKKEFRDDVSHAILICDWEFIDSITEEEYVKHGYSRQWQEDMKQQWYRDWKDRGSPVCGVTEV